MTKNTVEDPPDLLFFRPMQSEIMMQQMENHSAPSSATSSGKQSIRVKIKKEEVDTPHRSPGFSWKTTEKEEKNLLP
jgi:hypothetical protein